MLSLHIRTLLLLAASSFLLTTAPANATEPLPYNSMSPEDGFTRSSTSGAQEFTFQSSNTGISASVEVSSSPLLGVDGTLANDYQKDYFGMTQSDAFPGTYRGVSNHVPGGNWWTSAPGTYYWQIQGFCSQFGPCGGSEFHEYRGPVRRIDVAAPPPAPGPGSGPGSGGGGGGSSPDLTMYRSDLPGYLRFMIRKETNGRIRGLRKTCTRTSYRSFRCAVSWRIGAFKYSGRARLLHFREGQDVYWGYVFVGKRTKTEHCFRRCSRTLSWP